MNKVYAVVVAGGSGTRMQQALPKQFLPIHGKELFIYTLEAFLSAIPDVEIILVLPLSHMQMAKEILGKHSLLHKVELIEGGETRFNSVKNGLQKIKDPGVVMVHDAVRCMVTPAFLKRCLDACLEYGSSVPVMMSKDSVRIKDGKSYKVVDRETIFSIQTPQSFLSHIILPAFEIDYEAAFTDEATVVEKNGFDIHFIEGEDANLKITRPADLIFATHFFSDK
jgi:2-C-methyl-D-erythritol 4-phosphate cytidylyltransferase